VANAEDDETAIRRKREEIVNRFVQRATMTEIPSEDPRIRSFMLDPRPPLDLVADESDDRDQ